VASKNSSRPLVRSALRRVLLHGLDGVVRFGKEFTRYEPVADGRIVAHFEDGSSATGDVLVGADGIGSKVRAQYLPHAEVADLGLTSARWQVLGAVALAWTPLPVARVARNMGLSRQAVQRLVNDLAAGGLVEFAPNPYHRRARLVRLTAAGEHAFRAADDRRAPWVDRLAGDLDARDVGVALRVARALIRRLEAT
jgi:DNA-binding MarR family transcriptional regulator